LAFRAALWVLLSICLGCSQTVKKEDRASLVGVVEDMLTYDQPPTVISSGRPEYPDIARELGAEGRVVLKVLVLEDGKVGAVQILESPHPALTGNAVDAVRRCVFSPARWKGTPVKATVVMPFIFTLDRTFKRTSVTAEPQEPVSSPGAEAHEPRPRREPPVHITK
jgi:TonB family protein